nr:MAG TPA: hypothetical protein [Caudoviricetes sp.]DAU34394.1 MAG TPA: hypothetical protein [Caudoviricetes sp.]
MVMNNMPYGDESQKQVIVRRMSKANRRNKP